jgi:hypothetical protein
MALAKGGWKLEIESFEFSKLPSSSISAPI